MNEDPRPPGQSSVARDWRPWPTQRTSDAYSIIAPRWGVVFAGHYRATPPWRGCRAFCDVTSDNDPGEQMAGLRNTRADRGAAPFPTFGVLALSRLLPARSQAPCSQQPASLRTPRSSRRASASTPSALESPLLAILLPRHGALGSQPRRTSVPTRAVNSCNKALRASI